MVTMTMTAIVKMSNPKCTSTHHKDHSCEVSLQGGGGNEIHAPCACDATSQEWSLGCADVQKVFIE